MIKFPIICNHLNLFLESKKANNDTLIPNTDIASSDHVKHQAKRLRINDIWSPVLVFNTPQQKYNDITFKPIT